MVRTRAILTTAVAALALGAGAAVAAAAPAARAVPAAPTPKLAWVGRVVAPVVARRAPRPTARVRMRVSPVAPFYGGATRLLITRSTVRDGVRWAEVLLPMRPNGTRGWVRADFLTMSTTPMRIAVDIGRRRLRLFRSGRRVMDVPIAVGASSTPTPAGRLFAIAETVPTNQPGAFLGPYVLPLTGYSETLNEFAGGNGRVAIHGTSLPGLIGQAVSHGCMRMRNADVTRLAGAARPGTPVSIRP